MKKFNKVAEKNVTSTNTRFSFFLFSHPVKVNLIDHIMKFVSVITLSVLDQIKPNSCHKVSISCRICLHNIYYVNIQTLPINYVIFKAILSIFSESYRPFERAPISPISDLVSTFFNYFSL